MTARKEEIARPIQDTPENVAKAILSTPPKRIWRYLKKRPQPPKQKKS